MGEKIIPNMFIVKLKKRKKSKLVILLYKLLVKGEAAIFEAYENSGVVLSQIII